MVKQYDGDIFDAPIDVLIHQANCFCTFGSGIAKTIKDLYPEAYEADCKTAKGDTKKLGTYSSVRAKSQPDRRISFIVNLYSQHGFSDGNRATTYDAMVNGLTLLKNNIIAKKQENLVLGVPYKIGCGLGGGNWTIVEAILKAIFEDSKIKVLICKHPDFD
jgi:O-acetyl-ADP-ribose deacetylase (regulator of RNase III)